MTFLLWLSGEFLRITVKLQRKSGFKNSSDKPQKTFDKYRMTRAVKRIHVSEYKRVLFSLIPVEQPIMSFPGARRLENQSQAELKWLGYVIYKH